jgi:5-methylcytosine-specific restriction endonuclease McrA/predicted RNA-binding protein with PUA-like domain
MTHWIFQGNPDNFNVNKYLSSKQIIYWTVTHPKHQKMVSVGDTVFLWRAKGSSKDTPGIVAVGKIAGPCILKSQIPDPCEQFSDYLWYDKSKEPHEIKACIELSEVRLTKKAGMLTLDDIKADALLSKMRIVKVKTGSNFVLNKEEYERLLQLWDQKSIIVSITTKEAFDQELEKRVEESRKLSREDRQRRRLEAPKIPLKTAVQQMVFHRNPDVIVEVLERANGICERCHQPAPFLRRSDNTPYLEVHHRIPLAEGGEDTVENAIALCPNCHREMHFGLEMRK